MSEHRVCVAWERHTAGFGYEEYDRTHEWRFAGGTRLSASAAPEYRGRAELVNPEEALAAALASCHMLTFLALASRKRYVVDRYEDEAVAFLEKDAEGRLAITRCVLRPRVAFGGERRPGEAELARLHEQAHAGCFIANSVRSEVRVEPR